MNYKNKFNNIKIKIYKVKVYKKYSKLFRQLINKSYLINKMNMKILLQIYKIKI